MSHVYKVFIMVLGNTMDSHKVFMDQLKLQVKLCEANREDDYDYIIAFVPIVSRAGTDIQAAVERIPNNKPVILVVLHHTFDPDYIAPDSRLCVKRDRVFAVDCLFHEDRGLLTCQRNNDAISAVKEQLIREEHSKDWTDQEPKHQLLVQRNMSEKEREGRLPVDDSQSRCIVLPGDFMRGAVGVGGAVGGAVGGGVGGGVGSLVVYVVIYVLARHAGRPGGGDLGGTVGGVVGYTVRSAMWGAVCGAVWGAVCRASGVLPRHVSGARGLPLSIVLGGSLGLGVCIGRMIGK